MILLVEDDAILRIIPVVLDPETAAPHRAAVADFFAHDEPDFAAWCRRLHQRIPGLYPAKVVFAHDQADLDAKLPEADGVIVEGLKIGRDNLAKASRLKFVQRFGTVLSNVDTQACAERGVTVEALRRRVNIAVAEQAFAFMIALAKRLCELNGVVQDKDLRAAGFDPTPYDRRYTGNSNFARIPGLGTLYGATLGLVGMGEIGRELAGRAAGRAAGFGMTILYHQRNRIAAADEAAFEARHVSLEELMSRSDYISVQLPLNDSTRGLIGSAALSGLKPGAVLVNAARAELIDRDALIAALDSGRLAGFALDVGYEEPAHSNDPLLKYNKGNVILMPHTAVGARQNGLADLEEMCLKMWRALTQAR
jgi:phosphoglycerate dehydrogenase-like enzyme